MLKINLNIYSLFSLGFFVFSVGLYVISIVFLNNNYNFFFEWEIIMFNSSFCVVSFIFDWMSLMFLGSVFIIASGISKFSDYYMSGDENFGRFMILLGFFVLSMVFLIISPNLMSILLGWDGLGLTSYVLVVYYQNESSCNAGMLTILSNRIGDVCILMCVGLMLMKGSWNFIFVESKIGFLLSTFIVLAGMTKSAQIPFSAWLPAAMAAPTPVSALVHSSTLVTAGVYLLIRFYPLLENNLLWFLLLVSVITMFMSGLGANFETDMKKIIALSTLSQLGVMMMILSAGMPALAFFHLITHAMFKSTLFMCGGTIIHMSNGSQDSRFMSSLSSSAPFLMVVFSLTNLALSGFPFLAGFYSKDLILEFMFLNNYNIMLVFFVVLATGMTVSYSLRVMFLGMSKISNLKSLSDLEDNNKTLFLGMLILFFMSVLMGYFFSWFFLFHHQSLILSNMSKYYILMIMLLSSMLMIFLNKLKFKSETLNKYMVGGFSKMWNLPFLSTKLNLLFLKMSLKSLMLMDKGWLEFYGASGGKQSFVMLSAMIQKSQLSLMLKSYFMTMVMIVLFFFMLLVYK
uniref:NADH-ubiquinone oxidoreductase chain 5 n=1 Tax=Platorchestia sp. AKP-2018 TaxID=2306295 RepID=A0A385UL53_9CRUS|nr:NADH dehydrogenase subunit 5 [Platorchestia sp. AKP-2018]